MGFHLRNLCSSPNTTLQAYARAIIDEVMRASLLKAVKTAIKALWMPIAAPSSSWMR